MSRIKLFLGCFLLLNINYFSFGEEKIPPFLTPQTVCVNSHTLQACNMEARQVFFDSDGLYTCNWIVENPPNDGICLLIKVIK